MFVILELVVNGSYVTESLGTARMPYQRHNKEDRKYINGKEKKINRKEINYNICEGIEMEGKSRHRYYRASYETLLA